MTEQQLKEQLKNEYNTYIKNIDDFFYLPEYIQDKIIRNPYFDYVQIWDKLDYEHKQMIIMNSDFKYEELWNKLDDIEKDTVLIYVNDFNWKKIYSYTNR